MLFNQAVVGVPFTMAGYWMLSLRGATVDRELPTFHWVLVEFLVFIMTEEVFFYYSHRLAYNYIGFIVHLLQGRYLCFCNSSWRHVHNQINCGHIIPLAYTPRGGLAIWAIGHCPGAHHFRGPTPSPKHCEGPQQLSLPGGPEWSQSAPVCTPVVFNITCVTQRLPKCL